MVVEEEEDGVLYVFGRECVPCRRLRSAFAGASRDSQLAVLASRLVSNSEKDLFVCLRQWMFCAGQTPVLSSAMLPVSL